ncbi:hypothetical protein GY45DRAFT_435859 [Cubamyces sp. BRFM 1775]|nr:hypothetical protein GY45DRAFT_435859 [Cubamyces sp. BRFM 1775]
MGMGVMMMMKIWMLIVICPTRTGASISIVDGSPLSAITESKSEPASPVRAGRGKQRGRRPEPRPVRNASTSNSVRLASNLDPCKGQRRTLQGLRYRRGPTSTTLNVYCGRRPIPHWQHPRQGHKFAESQPNEHSIRPSGTQRSHGPRLQAHAQRSGLELCNDASLVLDLL